MPLRGRVGRHTQHGERHCQNWADDQEIVRALLNRISAAQGGAAGSLNDRTVVGMCSAALYQAIVRFENQHFPGQHSGFVDPGGKMLQRMEALANTSAPSPAPMPSPPSPPVPDQSALLALKERLSKEPNNPQTLSVVAAARAYVDGLLRDGATALPHRMLAFGTGYVAAAWECKRAHSWESHLATKSRFKVYVEDPPTIKPRLYYAEPLPRLHAAATTRTSTMIILVGDGLVGMQPLTIMTNMEAPPTPVPSGPAKLETGELKRRLQALDKR